MGEVGHVSRPQQKEIGHYPRWSEALRRPGPSHVNPPAPELPPPYTNKRGNGNTWRGPEGRRTGNTAEPPRRFGDPQAAVLGRRREATAGGPSVPHIGHHGVWKLVVPSVKGHPHPRNISTGIRFEVQCKRKISTYVPFAQSVSGMSKHFLGWQRW